MSSVHIFTCICLYVYSCMCMWSCCIPPWNETRMFVTMGPVWIAMDLVKLDEIWLFCVTWRHYPSPPSGVHWVCIHGRHCFVRTGNNSICGPAFVIIWATDVCYLSRKFTELGSRHMDLKSPWLKEIKMVILVSRKNLQAEGEFVSTELAHKKPQAIKEQLCFLLHLRRMHVNQ